MRTELWRGRRNIAAAAAWLLGMAVVVGPGMVRAFVAGTLVTSWVWMVFVASLIRTYPVTMGEWGESFTREVLAGREFGWPFLDDVPMEHRNIDHVAVSPRAVLAIETKFVGAGRQWATDRYREAAMDAARSSARSVRSILLSQGVKDVPVEPVLIVWGPGAALENDWAIVDGVHVVRGIAAADQWRRHCNSGDISPSRAKELIEEVWGSDQRHEVVAYVDAVRTVIENLTLLRPSEQRSAVLGLHPGDLTTPLSVEDLRTATESKGLDAGGDQSAPSCTASTDTLVELARATAADGRQRGVGATTPTDLEWLRDTARVVIGALPADDPTRFVLPWLWNGDRTTGRALTPEGDEFGYELRFSRYKTVQIQP